MNFNSLESLTRKINGNIKIRPLSSAIFKIKGLFLKDLSLQMIEGATENSAQV